MEPFLSWSVDPDRKVGDTGIVKTEFGYHIMYFSAGMEQWRYYARDYFINDRTNQLIGEATEKWPVEIKLDAVRLAQIDLA